jgi:hypothetical protein
MAVRASDQSIGQAWPRGVHLVGKPAKVSWRRAFILFAREFPWRAFVFPDDGGRRAALCPPQNCKVPQGISYLSVLNGDDAGQMLLVYFELASLTKVSFGQVN